MQFAIKRHFWIIFAAAAILILVACGGGEELSEDDKAGPAGQPIITTLDSAHRMHLAVALNQSTSDPQITSLRAPNSSTAAITPLKYCMMLYLGNANPMSCLQNTTDPAAVYAGDGSTFGMGPQSNKCSTVTLNSSFLGLSPAPGEDLLGGNYTCYQLVIGAPSTVPVEVKFPSGTTGIIEVYIEASNGAGWKLAGSLASANIVSTSFDNQNSRIFLLIRTDNGMAGQQMGIGVGSSAPTPADNSTLPNATVVQMGQTIAGNIAVPGSSEVYYFYPQQTGQTKQEVSIKFTANQSATYRLAQRTGNASYASLGAENSIPVASSGMTFGVTTANTPNSAGTTTPWGIMVKVRGINASAGVGESFTIRVSTQVNTISTWNITNTENISRLYPGYSGMLQVATYVNVALTVKDANGKNVPGETVKLEWQRNKSDPATKEVVFLTTDNNGSAGMRCNLPACTGAIFSNSNYASPGTPADHYKGTMQLGQVVGNLPNAVNTSSSTLPFLRICSETYLGRY